uniref:Plus3 domain-containing protein n=1 Tax=Calcidiscus leptoporus TaxID=127549 RepID=A0A7S0IXY8_9EUKA
MQAPPPAAPKPPKRKRDDREEPTAVAPLSHDELRALWLPRRHVEVWLGKNPKILGNTLVRCVQRINTSRTFYVGFVLGVRRSKPYRYNKQIFDLALLLRTSTGERMVGIDCLSDQQPDDHELSRFKVPLEPAVVRQQIRALQRAMQESRNLFEEEDLRRKMEEEERLRAKQEAAAAQEQREADELERKEREREELRRRQAERTAANSESEQWWLQYQSKGDDKEREVAKWKARLKRFEKIASSSAAEGERTNAKRLAAQARDKVEALTSQD